MSPASKMDLHRQFLLLNPNRSSFKASHVILSNRSLHIGRCILGSQFSTLLSLPPSNAIMHIKLIFIILDNERFCNSNRSLDIKEIKSLQTGNLKSSCYIHIRIQITDKLCSQDSHYRFVLSIIALSVWLARVLPLLAVVLLSSPCTNVHTLTVCLRIRSLYYLIS